MSFDEQWRELQNRRAQLQEMQRRSDDAYFQRQLRFNEQMGYAGLGIIASVSLGLAIFAFVLMCRAC